MSISKIGGYRALLGRAAYRRLALADVCARLPQGMLSVALLLVAAEYRPVAVAGLALSGYALGQGVSSPYRGRLADRYGLVRVATVCLVGYIAALTGVAVAAASAIPAGTVILASTIAGLSTPPLSAGMRGLWSAATPPFLRPTAFALDAAVFDACYIAGPALAGAVASSARPPAGLGLVLLLAGAAILVLPRSRPRRPAEGRPRVAVLRRPALRRLLLTAALVNFALSAVEVALTSFVRREHAVWAAGPLLAAVSVGSVLGSLLLGQRGSAAALPGFLSGYALGLLALAAATYVPPLLAVAAPIAGLCLGPTLATLFGVAAAAAPEGAATETQSWLNTIMSGGAAAGAAAAGLVAARPAIGLGLAVLAVALGAVGLTAGGNLGGAQGYRVEN